MMPHTALISLGSNLDQPEAQIHTAISTLNQHTEITVSKQSTLYRSKPWGPIQDQPDFINAIVVIKTSLNPEELLNTCQAIENKQDRRRDGPRFGPRTIDLDILIYDDLQIKTERLTLPHPRMLERDFVLNPLLELLT